MFFKMDELDEKIMAPPMIIVVIAVSMSEQRKMGKANYLCNSPNAGYRV